VASLVPSGRRDQLLGQVHDYTKSSEPNARQLDKHLDCSHEVHDYTKSSEPNVASVSL